MLLRRRLCLFLVLGAGTSSVATAAELQIVNSSGQAIHELYVAPLGQRAWGANRLHQKQPNVLVVRCEQMIPVNVLISAISGR